MSNISILSIKDEAYICYIVVYITEQCVSIYAGKIVGMDYNWKNTSELDLLITSVPGILGDLR